MVRFDCRSRGIAASSSVNFYAFSALPGCSRPASRRARCRRGELPGLPPPYPAQVFRAPRNNRPQQTAPWPTPPLRTRTFPHRSGSSTRRGRKARSRVPATSATSRRSPPAARSWPPPRRSPPSALKNALAAALQFDRRQALGEGAMAGRLAEGATTWAGGGAVRPGDDAGRRRRQPGDGRLDLDREAARPEVRDPESARRPRPRVLQGAADRRPEGEPARRCCSATIGGLWLSRHVDAFSGVLAMALPAAIPAATARWRAASP